jgi:hypothetical protein
MNHAELQSLIDLIFTKCNLRYGRDFSSRWEGLDMADVKDDWAHELTGIKPESVAYALKNLPDKAPTVGEFRKVALNAPEVPLLRIERPTANPEIAKAAIAKARAILTGSAA